MACRSLYATADNLGEIAMLRITHVEEPNATLTLKLEGKLLKPWLDELLHACDAHASSCNGICLDLSALTFVDIAGANLLRELIQRGIKISACSGYVAELLHEEIR